MNTLIAYRAQRKNDADPFANFEGNGLEDLKQPLPAGDPPAGDPPPPADPKAGDPPPEPKAGDPPAGDPPAGDPPPADPGDDPGETFLTDDSLALDDFEDLKNLPPAPADDEYGWNEIGKEIGLEDAEDIADLPTLKARIETVRTADKTKAVEDYLIAEKGYTPEAITYIKALNEGASFDRINEIEQPYRNFLNMTNEDKVRRSLSLIKNGDVALYTESEIDAKIESFIESGKLGEESAKLDSTVIHQMAERRSQYFKEVSDTAQKVSESIKAKNAQLDAVVVKGLREMKSFLGVPVSEEVTSALVKKYESGVYRKVMEKDPNAVIKFIQALELGDKAMKKLIGDETGAFRKQIQGKLKGEEEAAKIARTGASSADPSKAVDPNDPFANIPDTLNGMVMTTEYK